MAIPYRLQGVLRFRQQNRDMLQQSVALARGRHRVLVEMKTRLENQRLAILSALRVLNNSERLDVNRVIVLQNRAQELGEQIEASKAEVFHAAEKIEQQLSQLIKADQALQIIEFHADRHVVEGKVFREKALSLEFDDLTASARHRGSANS